MTKNNKRLECIKESQRHTSKALLAANRLVDLTRESKRLERKVRFNNQSVRPVKPKQERNVRRLDFIKPHSDKPVRLPSIEGTQDKPCLKTDMLLVLASESLEPIGGSNTGKALYRVQAKKQLIRSLSQGLLLTPI